MSRIGTTKKTKNALRNTENYQGGEGLTPPKFPVFLGAFFAFFVALMRLIKLNLL